LGIEISVFRVVFLFSMAFLNFGSEGLFICLVGFIVAYED
jgi:hypothetical protein